MPGFVRVRIAVTVALVGLLSLGSGAGAQEPKPLQPLLSSEGSAPVFVWGQLITTYRATVGGVPPGERAEQAARRIQALPSGLSEYEIEVQPTVLGADSGVVILVESQFTLGLVHGDLDPESGETLARATQEAVARLQLWLERRDEQRHWPAIVRAVLWSLAATLLAILLWWILRRLTREILHRLDTMPHARREFRIGRLDFTPYVIPLQTWLVRSLSWLAWAVVGYSWLTFCLHQFPYTRLWGEQLGSFILGVFWDLALKAVAEAPNLFVVAVIFVLARVLARIVCAIFRSAESDWMEPGMARATRRIVVSLVWVFALVTAYPYMPGHGTAAFQGVSVLLGIMVTLGGTSVVGQLLSGLVLVYTRAFSIGDFVCIGESEGTVTSIGALAVKLTTVRREEVTIPNSVVLGASSTNYSRQAREDGAVVSTEIGVGYDTPWRQVEELLLEGARRTSGVLAEPTPRVLKSGLSDFFVQYRLLFQVGDPAKRYLVRSELHAHVLDAFNESGIQIMTPHYEGQPEHRVVAPRSEAQGRAGSAPRGASE